MTTNTFKAALIQMYPEAHKVDENFLKAQKYIEKAAQAGASLAILPEYCLRGWDPVDPRFVSADGEIDIYLPKFKELARLHDINIVPGTMIEKVKNDKNEQVLRNKTYFISRLGEVQGEYTKRNLWTTEREHLESSGRIPHKVFETEYGKCGLLICWDLAFPEAFRELVAQGCRLIIIPSYWTAGDAGQEGFQLNARSEEIFMNSAVATRAFENSVAVIYVNVAGDGHDNHKGGGCTQATLPFLGPVAKTTTIGEEMVIADLDLRILEKAEENYLVRHDLMHEVWGYRMAAQQQKKE